MLSVGKISRFLWAGIGALAVFAMSSELVLADRAEDDGITTRTNYNRRPAPPTHTKVVKDFGITPMLTDLSVSVMNEAIGRYEKIVADGGWPKIPRGRTLVPGSKHKRVRLLKKRLIAEGYLDAGYPGAKTKKFDAQTRSALLEFQKAHGIYATGRVDKVTRKALSVSAASRLKTLKANLPRIKKASKKLGNRYIVVNIPAAQLDAVDFGIVYSRHNVIAGQASRPSPVLTSRVTEINFNPYWNAPVSIVEKDIMPKLRKSLNILKKLNIKIYDGYGGPEVDPKKVDWSKADPKRYHFRQQPGEENAMASVKINFSNPYQVYMHDTPTKQLFTAGARYFSSGCVRIDKVHILTDWILKKQNGWDKDRINKVVKTGERLDVKIKSSAPQVHFVYFTAWVSDDGAVHFRDDIYKLDGTGFVSGQPRSLDG